MNCKKLLYLLAVLFATFAIILPAVVLADDQAPPVVRQSTWGAIKVLYRDVDSLQTASPFGVQKPGVEPANHYSSLIQGWKLPFFGTWQISCFYGCGAHTGKDYYAVDWNLPGDRDCGQYVVAPAGGRVLFAGSAGDYGNTVLVDAGYGRIYRVAHLSSMSVNSYMSIGQGAILGRCGRTGRADGCHIHFVIYYPASYAGNGWVNGYSIPQTGISDHTNLYPGGWYPSYQGMSTP